MLTGGFFMTNTSSLFIGLMSGTSLDGVDGVLAEFDQAGAVSLRAAAYVPFSDALRNDLLALQTSGADEIHREAMAANALAHRYAECVASLLADGGTARSDITAIGAHGQTVRHRPELGYTRQINNPALLAELTGIDVIADFRSRDVAAGGQGAPLVPAFHQAVFGDSRQTRVVANIGGIGNISVLGNHAERVIGFDTGPGNVLMDMWIAQHRGMAYDADGMWAASGTINQSLLAALRNEDYFTLPPPKSTGRDLFDAAWLHRKLAAFTSVSAEDVQATLAALTATTLADAITKHAADATEVYVCGGGAYNKHLLSALRHALAASAHAPTVETTDALGIAPNRVEALAFAWLAHRHDIRKPGNLPAVTGARGFRMLGARYPA
jgi:anhydro-N-acetylmuramic acid kinase